MRVIDIMETAQIDAFAALGLQVEEPPLSFWWEELAKLEKSLRIEALDIAIFLHLWNESGGD